MKNFIEGIFWFQPTRPQTALLQFVGNVVCLLHYINTLKQELNGIKAYKETSTDEKTVVTSHSHDLPYKFAVNVKECKDKLPTMYWLPKLHKRPYKASSCATTVLFKALTSGLTAVKSRFIR